MSDVFDSVPAGPILGTFVQCSMSCHTGTAVRKMGLDIHVKFGDSMSSNRFETCDSFTL